MAIVIDNWEGAFAAVHDAYASHADDIDLLVAITKESFITMYSTENFYDYIEETLLSNREGLTVEQPSIGNLNIEDIRNSDYFFA
jgi:DNA-directed RNA polymerase